MSVETAIEVLAAPTDAGLQAGGESTIGTLPSRRLLIHDQTVALPLGEMPDAPIVVPMQVPGSQRPENVSRQFGGVVAYLRAYEPKSDQEPSHPSPESLGDFSRQLHDGDIQLSSSFAIGFGGDPGLSKAFSIGLERDPKLIDMQLASPPSSVGELDTMYSQLREEAIVMGGIRFVISGEDSDHGITMLPSAANSQVLAGLIISDEPNTSSRQVEVLRLTASSIDDVVADRLPLVGFMLVEPGSISIIGREVLLPKSDRNIGLIVDVRQPEHLALQPLDPSTVVIGRQLFSKPEQTVFAPIATDQPVTPQDAETLIRPPLDMQLPGRAVEVDADDETEINDLLESDLSDDPWAQTREVVQEDTPVGGSTPGWRTKIGWGKP